MLLKSTTYVHEQNCHGSGRRQAGRISSNGVAIKFPNAVRNDRVVLIRHQPARRGNRVLSDLLETGVREMRREKGSSPPLVSENVKVSGAETPISAGAACQKVWFSSSDGL